MPGPRKPTDPEHFPFELAPNLTLAQWKGVNKQGSASTPQDAELRDGVNIRPSGDGYRERGGLEKIITEPVGGIEGIFEFSDVGSPRSDIIPTPPPIAPGFYQISWQIVDGAWISAKAPGLAAVKYPLPIVGPPPAFTGIATFARPFTAIGKLIVGTNYTDASGFDPIHIYKWDSVNGFVSVLSITAPFTNSVDYGVAFSAGVEFDGNFYFSLWYEENALQYPRNEHQMVYRWDGENAPVIELDHTVVARGAFPNLSDPGRNCALALYSDGYDVFAIQTHAGAQYGAAGNVIKKRQGGLWMTLTMPATCTHFGASAKFAGISYGALVRYGNATYIAGVDQPTITQQQPKTMRILKFEAGALSEVWSYAAPTWDCHINLFVADGILYYNYTTASGNVFRTGSFNGSVWNDVAKVWTDAPQSVSSIPINVEEFAGEFWASVDSTAALRKTTGRNVLGLWSNDAGVAIGRFLAVMPA